MEREIIKCQVCGLWHTLPIDGYCNAHCVMFGRGYAAGLSHQAKSDREAVKELTKYIDDGYYHKYQILAALDKAAKEE